MTTLDWVALAFALLAALVGLRRGLLVGALSLAGIATGAIVGARLAPHLLPDGSRSPYTPLVALAGAIVFAFLFEGIGTALGGVARGALRFSPLRAVDSLGGFLLGGVTALAVVWVLGAVALQLPGQPNLRRSAQQSVVLQRLNEIVPPRDVLDILARVDPFPAIAGPAAPVGPPDPAVLRRPEVRRAAASVVRVLGTACGLGTTGSGWVAQPGLAVTNAHVVAGQDDTVVETTAGQRLDAEAVAFDTTNDVAVLRVAGLRARALPLTAAREGAPVAILGYPGGGPLRAVAGRIGQTRVVLSEDAYGRGRKARRITSFRGRVRQGNSGGPAVDIRGRVEATVFASRIGASGGFGVPADVVRGALSASRGPVATGECTR